MSSNSNGAGAAGGAFEVLMNKSYVNKKAFDLEAIGRENKQITEDFNASTETLLKMGIKGLTHNKLGEAVDTIMPETLKNPKRLISYAMEMAESVKRTAKMDEDLSTSFAVEDVK